MNAKPGSVAKRVGEGALRPLLSSHFQPNEFLKMAIREGRSEEILREISGCIEDVNEEIKIYITQHRDGLGGVQDVATLAEKYSSLSTLSQKLHRNVERLKKEALQSYDLVKLRTSELERIHSASTSLRYLRQFTHAKAQLDHVLKGVVEQQQQQQQGGGKSGGAEAQQQLSSTNSQPPSDLLAAIISTGAKHMDIRQMATAAKTISDLESLLDLPALADIRFVADHASAIRQFGQQLRRRAQDRLLSSLKERDQASVASSLQVFFNLQSLPEIVLLAVDATVRETVELSRGAIDLDGIVAACPELASHTGTRAAAVAAVLGGGGSKANSGATGASGGPASASQTRVALREAAHNWASLVHDQASQIHVLQRVVSKKEDPATHKRFVDVLRVRGAASSGSAPAHLAAGRLLELFWERLAEGLQEVAAEKIKSQPLAANRIYPCLRKAAVEIVENLRALSVRDLHRDAGLGALLGSAGMGLGFGSNAGVGGTVATGLGMGQGGLSQDGGMFGTLALPQDELLLLSAGASAKRSRGRAKRLGTGVPGSQPFVTSSSSSSSSSSTSSQTAPPASTSTTAAVSATEEQGLVRGLGPMRDRYLVGCYHRMAHPVTQMFPEMEGYTAAVPSKRDLQALMKTLQTELVNVAVESEVGLVRVVSREALKAIRLMATKIEGMVVAVVPVSSQQHGADSQRGADVGAIAGRSSSSSAASATLQLHGDVHNTNTQLVVLLGSLKEALEKLPQAVVKAAIEAPGSALGANAAGAGTSDDSHFALLQLPGSSSSGAVAVDAIGANGQPISAADVVLAELQALVASACAILEELTARQLVSPLVEALATHLKTLVFALPKEGLIQGGGGSGNTDVECSRAVLVVVKQLPELVKAHLSSLPPSPLVTAATEELCIRVMHAYISAAALVRPVTEASRMRAAKDLSALEVMVGSVAPGVSVREACPVVQEFKAFRRFLFNEESKGGSQEAVPSRSQIQSLPYFSALRPSTVLHMTIARATSQMPLPHETRDGGSGALQAYLSDLTVASDKTHAPEVSRDFSAGSYPALTTIRASYSDNWRAVPAEVASWQSVQASLDVLVQRTAVADGAQKAKMRAWYDSVLELGTMYFR